MYKFFGSVNLVDSHKKLRPSAISMEIYWVTQYNWVQLCTKVDIGITINNFLKLFRYEVKIDYYEK